MFPPFCMFYDGVPVMQILEGKANYHAPLNDWIHGALRPLTQRIIPDDNHYKRVFDKLEILMALGYAHRDPSEYYWAPPGTFGYNRDRDQVFGEIEASLIESRDQSEYVDSGIFGATAEECKQGLTKLKEFVHELGWWR